MNILINIKAERHQGVAIEFCIELKFSEGASLLFLLDSNKMIFMVWRSALHIRSIHNNSN